MNGEIDSRGRPEGNAAFFDALYEEHHRVVHAFLVGQLAESDMAADLLQETFLRVWRHIDEARAIPAERRRFWLFTVARNLVRDHHRRGAVRGGVEVSLPVDETLPADARSDPARQLSAKETRSAVEAAIQCLPVDLRTALTLSLLGEMTSEQIGASLGVPAGTVRSRISLARRRLMQDLELGKDSGRQKKVNRHDGSG